MAERGAALGVRQERRVTRQPGQPLAAGSTVWNQGTGRWPACKDQTGNRETKSPYLVI